MKRKLVTVILSLISVFCLAIGLAACEGGTSLRFELDEQTQTYTVYAAKHGKTGKTVVIPASYNGKSVTAIGEKAFEECHSLKSVVIPDSVTSIGDYAFSECYAVTSVTLTEGLISIGSHAFEYCDIVDLAIPASVTSIAEQAFYTCRKLASISVAQGNPVYHSTENCLIETDTNALILGCMNSAIPDSVTSIGDYAFYACFGLRKIEIPNSVTSIGNSAFGGCIGLKKVEIGSGVNTIGDAAFWYCDSLEKITFRGTTTEWKAIEKGENWRKHSVFLSSVVCSDATLTGDEIG